LEEEKEAADGEVKELTGMDKYKSELQLKMNEARRLNNKAVLQEQERLTDPAFEKRMQRKEFFD
jgi:hypothetical protein